MLDTSWSATLSWGKNLSIGVGGHLSPSLLFVLTLWWIYLTHRHVQPPDVCPLTYPTLVTQFYLNYMRVTKLVRLACEWEVAQQRVYFPHLYFTAFRCAVGAYDTWHMISSETWTDREIIWLGDSVGARGESVSLRPSPSTLHTRSVEELYHEYKGILLIVIFNTRIHLIIYKPIRLAPLLRFPSRGVPHRLYQDKVQ